MKDRAYFNSQLRKDPITKLPICEGKSVDEDSKLILELFERQHQLLSHYKTWPVKDGIKWLYGYANFINVKSRKRRPNKYHTHTYPCGKILMLDFFGGFGTELIYDHPAIVLNDTGDGLIVAPLTSNKDIYKNAPSITSHIQLPKNNPDCGDLNADSTIKLEQLRFVSKYRILQKKGRVKDKAKLNEIEEAITNLLAKYITNKKIETINILKNEKSNLEEDNNILKADNENLRNKLEIITKERDNLYRKLKEYEMSNSSNNSTNS